MYPLERYVHILILLTATISVATGEPEVTVQQGVLFGTTELFIGSDVGVSNVNVDVYKGVPFAEPPERFGPPVPKQPWTEDWNATYFRPGCIQIVTPLDYVPFSLSEDCLYLNVYVPQTKPQNASVMVYIHGGSYQTGSASTYLLSGVPLAAVGNVIIVTINYRLNIFGYLSTGDEASRGNYGFLDQAEALRWVKQNIAAFGGDSNRVTIFGNSAGSGSVDFQLYSKGSRDLFAQAILQSGQATVSWSFNSAPALEKQTAQNVGALVGCSQQNTAELVGCLKQVDAQTLLDALSASFGYTGPNLDGIFLTESPYVMLDQGDFKDCPLIVGFGDEEGTLAPYTFYADQPSIYGDDAPFMNITEFDRLLDIYLYWYNDDLVKQALKQEYLDWALVRDPNTDYFDPYVRLTGDGWFSCPAMEMVEAHSKLTTPVYLYYMKFVPTQSYFEVWETQSPRWLGSGHAEDIPFVFGWGFIPEIKELYSLTQTEKELSLKFMQYWTNFAKSGDPSREEFKDEAGTGQWQWLPYRISDPYYKELSVDFPLYNTTLRADECALWNGFIRNLYQFTASMDETEQMWREEFVAWQKDLSEWRSSFNTYAEENSCS